MEIICVKASENKNFNSKFIRNKIKDKIFSSVFGSNFNETIIIDKYGKPISVIKPYFNISYSGCYMVFLFSEVCSIGIDIEKHCEIDFYVYAKVFHNEENLFINNKAKRFFKVWTKKEAILKCHGIGLNPKMNTINTLENPSSFDNQNFYTKEVIINRFYSCNIASKSPIGKIDIKTINLTIK